MNSADVSFPHVDKFSSIQIMSLPARVPDAETTNGEVGGWVVNRPICPDVALGRERAWSGLHRKLAGFLNVAGELLEKPVRSEFLRPGVAPKKLLPFVVEEFRANKYAVLRSMILSPRQAPDQFLVVRGTELLGKVQKNVSGAIARSQVQLDLLEDGTEPNLMHITRLGNTAMRTGSIPLEKKLFLPCS
jgi:hypothetical protein